MHMSRILIMRFEDEASDRIKLYLDLNLPHKSPRCWRKIFLISQCRILCLENKQVTITNLQKLLNGFLFTYIDQPTNQITNQLSTGFFLFNPVAKYKSIY